MNVAAQFIAGLLTWKVRNRTLERVWPSMYVSPEMMGAAKLN